MMNEEQLEAHAAEMERWTKRRDREHGFRTGREPESRKHRIARLRRYRRSPNRYPEFFNFRPDSGRRDFRIEAHRVLWPGCDIFVTSVEQYWPKMDEPGMVFHWRRFYNGYCRFLSKPVIERGDHGLLTYVPMHGGCTYACHYHGVAVYGFDTAHAGDDENALLRNVEYLERECYVAAVGIRVAARYEPEYLRRRDSLARAEVVDKFLREVERRTGKAFNLLGNFSAMLNALSGKV